MTRIKKRGSHCQKVCQTDGPVSLRRPSFARPSRNSCASIRVCWRDSRVFPPGRPHRSSRTKRTALNILPSFLCSPSRPQWSGPDHGSKPRKGLPANDANCASRCFLSSEFLFACIRVIRGPLLFRLSDVRQFLASRSLGVAWSSTTKMVGALHLNSRGLLRAGVGGSCQGAAPIAPYFVKNWLPQKKLK